MMTKSFQLNRKKDREINKTNYKKHPLWEKNGIWIRIFLPLGWILMLTGVFSGIYGFINAPGSVLINTLFMLMFPSMFVAFFFTYRLKWLQMHADDCSGRLNSTLTIDEHGIVSGYTLIEIGYESRHIVEIAYDKIEKLIYNDYHERLFIVGEGCLTVYEDYSNGKIYVNEESPEITGEPEIIISKLLDKNGGVTFNSHMVIYDIFDDFKTFMQIVSERSNVEIQRLNVPEAIDQPKYNADNIYDGIK